ncbi:MAG: antagonist of KipI [Kosmotogales bacterium]|nr:antagonist of KipI [Kosmotogales bacterium]
MKTDFRFTEKGFRGIKSMEWIYFHKPGFFTTIQGIGRSGYSEFGIPGGGSVDFLSSVISNYLSYSGCDNPVFEFTLEGPTIEFNFDSIFSITGANMHPKVNDLPVEMYKTLFVKKGDVLSFGKVSRGFRTYLSINSKLNIAKFLGSFSTYTNANYGGYRGRQIKAGDYLYYESASVGDKRIRKAKKDSVDDLLKAGNVLRIIEGPEYSAFESNSLKRFFNSEYSVSKKLNRMGIRLEGERLESSVTNISSSAVLPGIIQVPGDGLPIILLADCQTTGGYPRLGKIIDADMIVASQLKPIDRIVFKKIPYKTAERLSKRLRKHINKYI